MDDKYITLLERRIFNYFLNDFKDSLKEKSNESLPKLLESYSEGESLNSTIHMSYFVEKVLNPEFGITLKDLLVALKENKISFKDYIISILKKPEYKLSESLRRKGYSFKEDLLPLLFNQMNSDNNGAINSDEKVDPEEAKKQIIKASLGSEDVNLDSVDDEDLDNILAKVVPTTEKIEVIKDYLKEKDDETKAKYISHYTGMKFSESLEIIKKDW